MNEFYLQFRKLSQNKLNIEVIQACQNYEFEKLKYLLTAPELKKHAQINYKGGNSLLETACILGNFPAVNFLFTSPELKGQLDKNASTDGSFSPDFFDNPFNYAVVGKHYDIVKFFIFDMNVEKTELMDYFLKKLEHANIDNWFKMRELNKNLQEDLPNEDIKNNKKPKI